MSEKGGEGSNEDDVGEQRKVVYKRKTERYRAKPIRIERYKHSLLNELVLLLPGFSFKLIFVKSSRDFALLYFTPEVFSLGVPMSLHLRDRGTSIPNTAVWASTRLFSAALARRIIAVSGEKEKSVQQIRLED